MPISNKPVPCWSVNGLVKIRYDSSKVTALRAVVICSFQDSLGIHISFPVVKILIIADSVMLIAFRTIAVVAAPKMAMRERTETWPMNVAIASNTNTPYT